MARPTANIQASITRLEATVAAIEANPAQSYSVNGRTLSYKDLPRLYETLNGLYAQLGQANGSAPRFVRGVVTGLG